MCRLPVCLVYTSIPASCRCYTMQLFILYIELVFVHPLRARIKLLRVCIAWHHFWTASLSPFCVLRQKQSQSAPPFNWNVCAVLCEKYHWMCSNFFLLLYLHRHAALSTISPYSQTHFIINLFKHYQYFILCASRPLTGIKCLAHSPHSTVHWYTPLFCSTIFFNKFWMYFNSASKALEMFFQLISSLVQWGFRWYISARECDSFFQIFKLFEIRRE